MGVVGHHRADGHAAHAVHIGGVDHGDVHLAGLGVLAHVAHLAAEGHLRLQGRGELAALARGIGAGGPVGLDVAADRRQGLASVVAGRHVLIAHGQRVLAGGDVFKADVLTGQIAALLGDDDQIVVEHGLAGVLLDVARLNRIVHGALRGRNEDVGVLAGTEHLVQRAGSLVLSVAEGDVGVLLSVELLGLGHGLGQGIGGENLQLHRLALRLGRLGGLGFRLGGSGLIGLLLCGIAARAAEQTQSGHKSHRYGAEFPTFAHWGVPP